MLATVLVPVPRSIAPVLMRHASVRKHPDFGRVGRPSGPHHPQAGCHAEAALDVAGVLFFGAGFLPAEFLCAFNQAVFQAGAGVGPVFRSG